MFCIIKVKFINGGSLNMQNDMQEDYLDEAEYNEESIDGFEYAERVRQRPAVMLGSNSLAGARHGFIEIYGNALDEIGSGYGKEDGLQVKRYIDGSISVRDFGRGVPLGWNANKKMYNWHLVYNELYMGGKTKSTQAKLAKVKDWSSFNPRSINYLYAVGLNGLGATSTQYASEWFEVKSYKGGFCTEMHYKGGYPVIDGEPCEVDKGFDWSRYKENKYETDEKDGTFVKWKPDDLVFTDTNITFKYLCSVCEDIACVAHINVELYDEETDTSVTYSSGVEEELLISKLGSTIDDVTQIFTSHELAHGTKVKQGANFIYVVEADVAFTFVSDNAPICFNHNYVKISSGAHLYGYNDAVSDFLRPIAKGLNLKLIDADYQGTLACVVSTRSNDSSFLGQTKSEVDDFYIRDIVTSVIFNKLTLEYAKGNAVVKEYVDFIMEKAQIRASRQESAKITKELSKVSKQKISSKYSTCDAYEKHLPGAELWLAEGDSAKGAIVSARQFAFQAAFPLRGKILNAVKASKEDILANEEIKNIFALIETGMDLGGGSSNFDITKLRFDKIIFATDGDEDGFQIRVLLFLVFYKLAPDLLKECGVDEQGRPCSHVFIAETPRFGITLRNGEVKYVNTDEARDKVYSDYVGQVVSTERYKGLGETDPEVLSLTTVHPETRNLIPIVVDFADTKLSDLIDALFGMDKYKLRKEILAGVLGESVADMLSDNSLRIGDIDNSDMEDGIDYEDIDM